jgi:hypothetical protein
MYFTLANSDNGEVEVETAGLADEEERYYSSLSRHVFVLEQLDSVA